MTVGSLVLPDVHVCVCLSTHRGPGFVFSSPWCGGTVFGTMIEARTMFVTMAWKYLARASTIAIRYSCVRRQFLPKGVRRGEEVKVLDYQTQQHKLLPLLANVFAFFFTGVWLCVNATACATYIHIHIYICVCVCVCVSVCLSLHARVTAAVPVGQASGWAASIPASSRAARATTFRCCSPSTSFPLV